MNNSGTPGLTPFLMDLTADANLELPLRLAAATTLYGLIARAWAVEVRPMHRDSSEEASATAIPFALHFPAHRPSTDSCPSLCAF